MNYEKIISNIYKLLRIVLFIQLIVFFGYLDIILYKSFKEEEKQSKEQLSKKLDDSIEKKLEDENTQVLIVRTKNDKVEANNKKSSR